MKYCFATTKQDHAMGAPSESHLQTLVRYQRAVDSIALGARSRRASSAKRPSSSSKNNPVAKIYECGRATTFDAG